MPKAPAKKSYVQTMIRRDANGKLRIIAAQLDMTKIVFFDRLSEFSLDEFRQFLNTKK